MSSNPSQVSPQELSAVLTSGNAAPLLLDVRTPVEHREVHLENCQLVPLDQLDPSTIAGSEKIGPGVVVICRSGGRAKKAAGKLAAAGIHGVRILDGGMLAWEAAGLPVKRGKKTMSLERQVRIAAGTLVLTGVILGTWVHAGFYGLSAFVGAGLVFAGITDWCGMGLLFAKAPWNQTKGDCSCSTR